MDPTKVNELGNPEQTQNSLETSSSIVTPPLAIPKQGKDLVQTRLKNIHQFLIEDKTDVPEDFGEFVTGLTPQRLQGVYDHLNESPKVDKTEFPKTFDEFYKGVGHSLIPGIEGVSTPKIVPNGVFGYKGNLLQVAPIGLGGNELPFNAPTLEGRPPVDVTKGAGEYLTTLAARFNYPIYKTLEFLGDLQNTLSWAIAEPQTMIPWHKQTQEEQDSKKTIEWLGINGFSGGLGPVNLKGVANFLEEREKLQRDRKLPGYVDENGNYQENFTSRLLSSAASMSGELVQTLAVPEVATGSMLSSLGVKTLPKIVPLFTFTGVRDSDKSKWYGTYRGALEGAVSGVEMAMMGNIGEYFGKGLTKLVSRDISEAIKFPSQGVKLNPTGDPILDPFLLTSATALSTSAVFGTDNMLRQSLGVLTTDKKWEDFSWGEVAQNMGIGMVMSTPGLIGSGRLSLVQAYGDRVRAKMFSSWANASNNTVSDITTKGFDPERANQRLNDINIKISKLPEEATELRMKLSAEASVLGNMISLNAQTWEILKNPEAFKSAIRSNETLPDNVKELFINKVDETLKIADPITLEVNKRQDRINTFRQDINRISNDKSLTEDQRQTKKSAYEELINKELSGMKELYSKEYYWMNGTRYNSESELRSAVENSKGLGDIMKVVIRNNPSAFEWVHQQQVLRANDEIKNGIRSGELAQVEQPVIEQIDQITPEIKMPELIIPDRVNAIINRVDRGETVTGSNVQDASDILYGEYSRLGALKSSKGGIYSYTPEQITRAQEFLEDEILNLEKYGNREEGNYAKIQSIKSEAQVQATENAKPEGTVQADGTDGGGSAESSGRYLQPLGVASILVAPYYDTKIKTLDDAGTLRSSEGYKTHLDNLGKVADQLGLSVDGISETIGGFQNDKGDKIVEISNRVNLKDATIDEAERYAALMGLMTPETQEATIAARYVKEGSDSHNVDEISLKVSDIDKTIKALQDADIYVFTINETDKTISFLDFMLGKSSDFDKKIDIFADKLKENGVTYENVQRRAVESRYIDPKRRGEIIREVKESPLYKGQGRENLRGLIDQAEQRHQEFIGEKVTTPPEPVNQNIQQGVQEVMSFLNDQMFHGETADLDRALGVLSQEVSQTAKTSGEVFGKVSDILRGATSGNEWASKKVEDILNSRREMIEDTFKNSQETNDRVISKGKLSNIRGDINRVKEEEQTYRNTVKEEYDRDVQRQKDNGTYMSSAGLSQKDLELAANLASSYIRQGVKTAKAVYDAIKQEFKASTGKSLRMDDMDEILEHSAGKGKSPNDYLGMYEEETSGGTPEESSKREQTRKTKGELKESVKTLKEEINSRLGIGKQKPTSALRDQLLIEGTDPSKRIRAAKRLFGDWIKENAKKINEVAPELSSAMLNKVNSISTEKSLQDAIRYVESSITKKSFADMAGRLTTNRKKAISNLKAGKFGNLYGEAAKLLELQYKPGKIKVENRENPFTGDMERLLNIDESNIPTKDLVDYDNLLQRMSGRGELRVSGEEIRNMLDRLQKPLNDQLKAQLDRMELDSKLPNTASLAEIEKLRQVERDLTFNHLRNIENIDSRLLNEDERRILGEFRKYSKEDLDGLTVTQMRKARLIIDNAKDNGWLSNRIYSDIVYPVRVNQRIKGLAKDYFWARIDEIGKYRDTKGFKDLSEVIHDMGKGKVDHNKLYRKLKYIPMDQLDMALGGGVNTPLYKEIHRPFNEVIGKTEHMFREIDASIESLSKNILRGRGFTDEAKATSTILMDMYAKEREYQSNKNNPRIAKSLEYYVNNTQKSQVSRDVKELIQRLFNELPRTTDGSIDLKSFWDNTLTSGERNMMTYMDNVSKNRLMPMQRFANVQYRGEAFEEVIDYAHKMVEVDVDEMAKRLTGEQLFEQLTTAAGSGKSRVGSEVVRFDRVGSFLRGAKQTILDYHLTPVVKETFGTFRGLKVQQEGNLNAIETITALENAYMDNLKFQTAGALADKSVFTKLMRGMLNGSYNSALAGISRVISEMTSNGVSALMYDPDALYHGAKNIIENPHQWNHVYEFIGSSHIDRLGAYGDELEYLLSNDMSAMASNLGGPRAEKIVNTLNNNKARAFVNHVNRMMIQVSDNTLTKPFWRGRFLREFNKLTKEEFDIEKFTDDAQYRDKFGQQIKDAGGLADYHTTLMYNSAQSFDRALSTKVMPNDGWRVLKMLNNFLVGYGRREYYSTLLSAKAMIYGNRPISRWDGARLMSTIMVRNAVYTGALQYLSSIKMQMIKNGMGLPSEDDEQKGNIFDDPRRYMVSVAGNIVSGKWGNYGRMAMAYGLNALESMYTTKVLRKQYDPIKHAVMYTKGNIFTNPDDTRAWIGMMGPLSYMANWGYDGAKLTQRMLKDFEDNDFVDGFSDAMDDKKLQFQALDWGLQSLNLTGLVPAYREVKPITQLMKFNAEDLDFGVNLFNGENGIKSNRKAPFRNVPNRSMPSRNIPSRR